MGPKPRAPRDPARAAAYECLARHAERFPDLLPASPDVERLGARDAAFAHAICDAAVRRWITLASVLSPGIRGGWERLEARVRGALLGGAAQMLLLDRVPVHAAIDETVEWVKSGGVREARAAGLVNAVLRRAGEIVGRREPGAWRGERGAIPLASGGVLRFTREVLAEDATPRLGAATSHPAWLLERWDRTFGEEECRRLAMHDLVEPPTVLNVTYARSAVMCPGLEFTAHARAGHVVVRGAHAVLAAFLGERGDVWAQDSASSRAVERVAGMAASLVVDVCAGRGTKSRQLLAAIPGARLIASDTDDARFEQLTRDFAGDPRVEVVPPGAIAARVHGTADLVLLDVPCSNSGVLARRAEARYRCEDAQLRRLVDLQRRIFMGALALARRGGRILYSTCSLEGEENEEQVAWMQTQGLAVVDMERTHPQGLPGGADEAYSDGSFWALLHCPE